MGVKKIYTGLESLGSKVFAVDRAELVENLMNDSKVEFMKHDAFTLKPEDLGKFDWIFSYSDIFLC